MILQNPCSQFALVAASRAISQQLQRLLIWPGHIPFNVPNKVKIEREREGETERESETSRLVMISREVSADCASSVSCVCVAASALILIYAQIMMRQLTMCQA